AAPIQSRRAAAIVQRAARRDVARGTAARAARIRRAIPRSRPWIHAEASDESRHHRLGASERPARRHRHRAADTIRPVLRRALVALVRPADPRADPLAHPDDPQRALTATPDSAPSGMPVPAPVSIRPRTIALAFAAALALCLLAYLAYAVPGRWISSAAEQAFGATRLSVPRGTATLAGNDLVVSRAAEDGNTVVSVNADFRAADYPVVAWIAGGFTADARVALLWRTDVEPARVNKRVLDVQGDGLLVPADVHEDPHWLGRIVGLSRGVCRARETPD